MDFQIVDIDNKNKMCYIKYNGKDFSAHYDYYSGRFTCYDENDAEYIFPDYGEYIHKVFKYKTFAEQVSSHEFMMAFTTEMEKWEPKRW